jgi:hypothetical protein
MKSKWLKYTNIKWLIITSLATGIYILCSLLFKHSIWPPKGTTKFNGFIEATFSAAILLLLSEIIQYRNDKRKLGYLAGTYIRKSIVQVNEGGVRSSSIDPAERERKERKENIKFQEDYKYHALAYYACAKEEYRIELKYEFAGNYSGVTEYYDHKAGKTPFEFPKPKTKVGFTLNLNVTDRITGAGSYKYYGENDFGAYEFHVIGERKDSLLVYYKNIFPNGLAEGYEIWERKG